MQALAGRLAVRNVVRVSSLQNRQFLQLSLQSLHIHTTANLRQREALHATRGDRFPTTVPPPRTESKSKALEEDYEAASSPALQHSAGYSSSHEVKLRPYQEDCLRAISVALDKGLSRMGVSSPTGSGKTTMFGELISRIKAPSPTQTRVMILVSSIQLAVQTAEHVKRRYPDLWVEVEQGQKLQASGHADVTVATYQTLVSLQSGNKDGMERLRLEKFDASTFKAIIVDEAHHAASRSWRVILNHFDDRIKVEAEEPVERDAEEGQMVAPPAAVQPAAGACRLTPPIIGFSATFSRHDGLSLGAIFEEIVFHRDVLDLIDEAWLSPLRFTSIQANIPLDTVSLSGGNRDFNTTSLSKAINTKPVNRLVVRSWLAKARQFAYKDDETPKESKRVAPAISDENAPMRTRTLVFAVDIQHVEDLTNEFRSAGIDARFLTGGTPMAERTQLLQDFRDGVFPILVNCSILTEGADIPAIDCVLLARPTLSRNLFSQMIGRGMRLSPSTGKKDCLILDLVGNCSKGLVCTPTLFGLDPTLASVDTDTAEMMELRRQKLAREGEVDQNRAEEKAWRTPLLSGDVHDPEKVTFTDYSSAASLHEAMSAKALFSSSVSAYSSNSWIDCGDDVFVVDIPPNRGYVRVERSEGLLESGSLAHERDRYSDMEGELSSSQGWKRRQLETGWEKKQGEYIANFVEVVPKTEADSVATTVAAAGRPGRWCSIRRSPYKRARKILEAETLEQAIRGSDTYIAMQVLKSSGRMRTTMSRFAPWRSAPASALQKAFVAKRLGIMRRFRSGIDQNLIREGGDGGEDLLRGLTKGEASIIITRLNHGAKSRWQREVRKQNKELEKHLRIEARRERETIRVGKLSQR